MWKRSILLMGALLFGAVSIASPSPAEAGLRIKERTKYYNISGKTGAQLFRSISRKGPRKGHAIATTTMTFRVKNVKTAVRGRRCVVTSADVSLDLTYLYPRWRNQRRAGDKVRNTWKAFEARVVRHELRHGDIAKKYAKRLEREIKRMSGRVSRACGDFGRRSRARIARLQARHSREQARFDRRESRVYSRVRRLQVALAGAR